MPTITDKTEALETLRALFKGRSSDKALTVYTSIRSVSRSGMSRTMDLYVIRNGELRRITWHVAQAAGFTLNKRGHLKVSGCGMDMGFHVVYNLGHALFTGTDRAKRSHNASAGYALSHRWIG